MSTLPKRQWPNDAVRNYAVSGIEPTLNEVLDDPSVRLLMARDGVTRSDLERLIQSKRHSHLAGQSPTQC
jgi:hypothetical protein